MPMKWLLLLQLLQLTCYFTSGSCGKVLVWPVEFSHWMNMKTILDELVTRGHEVTVLESSASTLIDPNKPLAMKFETFPVSLTKDDFQALAKILIETWMLAAKESLWIHLSTIQSLFDEFSDIAIKICKEAVSNKKLMKKLQESKFDVVLADAVGPCGELLAEILKVPLVYSLYFSPGYSVEKKSGKLSFPPSYVPVMMSELSDHMTFMERRVKNMIYVLYFDYWFQLYNEKWNQFYSEVLGRSTTLSEVMGKAEMWLIRNYWDFSFPRPRLPNVEFVGGLHCKPAKPLPKEMEEFVQSSGEHGIVVFSLGSMVSNINMSEERANVIASALAQIPQKVHTRKDGQDSSNFIINHFIEIRSILGHPKTKAFITHGGSNGIYEAIYHGIPMVDLFNALKIINNNLFYKENVMRLSAIQHDQPMKPLDRAIFWIEFVMRHKGAKHLRPAAHNLTWFQIFYLTKHVLPRKNTDEKLNKTICIHIEI
uniref:glucuronosyltransferase n=1 Tax=Capra hircus TaxID=9925 RepID=A0A8C2R7Z9_CAPHI